MDNFEREKMKNLRVWWMPQVPGTPFHVEVSTLKDGALLLDTFASYDNFLLEEKIKPDHSNMGGLEVKSNGKWGAWEIDTEFGYFDDPVEYFVAKKEFFSDGRYDT